MDDAIEKEDGGNKGSVDVDTDSIELDPSLYTMSSSFNDARKNPNKAKGVFNADVVRACFEGDIEPARGENNVTLVGRLHESVFGMVVDTEDKVVIAGHVLQCNPVQARISGLWDDDTVTRMQRLAKSNEGKVWQGYDDPYVGNKSDWNPSPEYDEREYE